MTSYVFIKLGRVSTLLISFTSHFSWVSHHMIRILPHAITHSLTPDSQSLLVNIPNALQPQVHICPPSVQALHGNATAKVLGVRPTKG